MFVDAYVFDASQGKEMMRQACRDIDASDMLIAEVSEKAIGVGIEVGYAKAQGKRIVYVRQEAAAYSTTVGGVSDDEIVYVDAVDLEEKLENVLRE